MEEKLQQTKTAIQILTDANEKLLRILAFDEISEDEKQAIGGSIRNNNDIIERLHHNVRVLYS